MPSPPDQGFGKVAEGVSGTVMFNSIGARLFSLMSRLAVLPLGPKRPLSGVSKAFGTDLTFDGQKFSLRPNMGVTSLGAGPLFAIAKEAHNNAKSDATCQRDPGNDKALTAIIFSYLTLEAYVNSISFLARSDCRSHAFFRDSPPVFLQILADLLEEAEKSGANTKDKFWVAGMALPDPPYTSGHYPYQDFTLLSELRNRLVHPKPKEMAEVDTDGEIINGSGPKILKKLRSKKVSGTPILGQFGKGNPGLMVSWLEAVETEEVARWACRVTADMIKEFRTNTPDSVLRSSLDQASSSFQFP